jgi:hypothetical protein
MMTHFLYRSQEKEPTEFLQGSRGFRKRLGTLVSLKLVLRQVSDSPSIAVDYEAAEAGIPGSTGNLTDKIAVTVYLASSDDSSRVNVSRIVRPHLQHGF